MNMKKIFALLYFPTLAGTVMAMPVVTSAPQSRAVRVGDRVAFVVGATGSSVTYQWSFNGTNITDATSAFYAISSAQSADAGTYSVLITDSSSESTNGSAALSVTSGLQHLNPANLVVLRAGDGTSALVNTGNPLFLDQIQPDGTYVSTVAIPDSGSNALIGFNTLTDHYLSSSANNRAVIFGGFNVNRPYSANLANSVASAAPRGIGSINGLGYYSLAVSESNSIYDKQFIKGVTSTDGSTEFWTSGGSGIVYVAPALSPEVQIATGGRSSMSIYEDSLYTLLGGGLYEFSGLPISPTTPGQVLATSANPNDFAISPDGLTIYVADGSNISTGGGGIRRYDNVDGGWTLSYTFTNVSANPTGNNGPDGLAVDFSNFSGGGQSGTGAIIYATSGQATQNNLMRIIDNGYTDSPAPIIYTAGVNQVIRGIRFAPVADPPAFVTQPLGQTNAPGANVTLTANVSGSAPFTYQWKKNGTNLVDGGNISGANSLTLTLANVSAGDSGDYTLTVENDLDSVTSDDATLAVAFVPLAIIHQPENVTTNYGAAVTFSVGVSGNPPFSYQWIKGDDNLADGVAASGATISGALTDTLTISGVNLADAGEYKVVVTGSSNQETSSNAVLAVFDPYIVTQPVNVTNGIGQTAVFTVAGDGTPPITYTWYKNHTASIYDDGRIFGVDTATLTIPSLVESDAGTYTAYVFGANGSTNSVDVTLTVLVPAGIRVGPESRTVRVGDQVAFSVGATGTALGFQWLFNDQPIDGATNSSFLLSNVQLTNMGTYSVVVSNSVNTTNANATLTVREGLLHLSSTNLVVLRAGDGTAPLANTGNSLFLDQITTNGTYVSTVTIPDSGDSALLGFNALTDEYLSSSANNSVVMFGGFHTTKPYGSNLGQSAAAAVPRGIGTVNGLGYFSLAVADTNSLYNGQILKGVASIDGQTEFWTSGSYGVIYTAGTSDSDVRIKTNGGRYSIGIVSNNLVACLSGGLFDFGGLPTTTTTPTQLFEATNPDDFVVSPDGQTIYLTEGSNLSTDGGGVQRWDFDSASGTWSKTYTFSDMPGGSNKNNGPYGVAVDFSQFTGGGSAGTGAVIYATTGISTENNIVRIEDNGPGSPTAIIYTVGVNQVIRGIRFAPIAEAVSIATQPESQTVSGGSDVTLSVIASGSAPFGYQWMKGSQAIDGATNSTLVLTNVQLADNGNYSVIVTNDISSTNSMEAVLTVTSGSVPNPIISSIINNGPSLTITWTNVVNDMSYRLQYNTDLSIANWIDVTPDVIATNGAASTTVSIGGPQTFYRVRVP